MAYLGRASLCPRNYCPPGTSELMGRVVSFTTKKEGKREGKKSKADWLPPLSLERLGARPGASAEVPKCQQAPVTPAPAGSAATQTGPSPSPPPSSRHRQGRRPRARPGRARPAISSPVIRSPPRSGLDSLLQPPRVPHGSPRGRLGHRPGRDRGSEASEPQEPGRALDAVPHLRVEKGHAARFGIVLIRAVRHLGVKSLLPLHAGRKRFSLAGLGEAEGEREGEREPG